MGWVEQNTSNYFRHGITYREAFTARDMIDFILNKCQGISSRDEAITLANRLLDLGFIVCASGKKSAVEDNLTFFRFNKV